MELNPCAGMMQGYTLLDAGKGLKKHCFIHGLLLYCPLDSCCWVMRPLTCFIVIFRIFPCAYTEDRDEIPVLRFLFQLSHTSFPFPSYRNHPSGSAPPNLTATLGLPAALGCVITP